LYLQVETFLAYTDAGSGFVFGYLASNEKPPFNPKLFENNTSITFDVISAINDSKIFNTVFIFKSLSVIYFFSFIISMLFYLGTMQWIIGKVGWVLQVRDYSISEILQDKWIEAEFLFHRLLLGLQLASR
jgi:nucleoside permease NupC